MYKLSEFYSYGENAFTATEVAKHSRLESYQVGSESTISSY